MLKRCLTEFTYRHAANVCKKEAIIEQIRHLLYKSFCHLVISPLLAIGHIGKPEFAIKPLIQLIEKSFCLVQFCSGNISDDFLADVCMHGET